MAGSFLDVFRVLQQRRLCEQKTICMPAHAIIQTNSMLVAHKLASRLRCATIFDFTDSIASVEGYTLQPSTQVHGIRMDFKEYLYNGDIRLLQPLVSAQELEDGFGLTIRNWTDNAYPAAILNPCQGEGVAFLVTQSRMDDSFSQLAFSQCTDSIIDLQNTTLSAKYLRFRMMQQWKIERFPSMYVLSESNPPALALASLSGRPPLVHDSIDSLRVTTV